MHQLTHTYLGRAETWLLVSLLAYFLLNGAQIYETAVLIPKWSVRPPASLAALQGTFAPDLKRFWVASHALHEISFIIALILCWKIPGARTMLLIIFGLHFGLRFWTVGYFAPRIMQFQATPPDSTDTALASQVRTWVLLNYLRVGGFIALSIWMLSVYRGVSCAAYMKHPDVAVQQQPTQTPA